MLYNELEQGDILSGVRWRLALLAYTDILLCSIWAMRRIRQTPVDKIPQFFDAHWEQALRYLRKKGMGKHRGRVPLQSIGGSLRLPLLQNGA